MSNHIKKGLVLLSLALVYISGSAARLPEHAQNQGREVAGSRETPSNPPKEPPEQRPTEPQKQAAKKQYAIHRNGSPPKEVFKYKQRKDPPEGPGLTSQ